MFEKIMKFAVAGGLGTVTNLLVFFVLADLLKLNENFASCAAFLVAGTQNYCLNHKWTFRTQAAERLGFALWAKYIAANLVGLAVNIVVMNVLLRFFEWKFKFIPQGIGILCGMTVNFLFANFFVFGGR